MTKGVPPTVNHKVHTNVVQNLNAVRIFTIERLCKLGKLKRINMQI